ncbi:glycine/betaine ABC transporter permease [Salipaludibacillus keqinensis]|uniref:Glycine/betaine ABC transporter permease n=1 Tax=Salipaludibacillus keqinensis TaxID=2045207 RepID=A0A323TJ30_9BACI|nr:BCCT family transporter [Salipaludibacillus keqinensis]PYZ93994.1 glycine/betaine ABC transporter permease [Salipaludibacillus keqinensis]
MKKLTIVFWSALVILLLIVGFGVIAPQVFENATFALQQVISSSLGWYYLLIVTSFVLVCLFFIVSPYGKIKLGKPDDKPDFNVATWFAMLFSAGMGIGLVFWGAAEPISHYMIDAPIAETGTDAAILESMRFTFFHWGIHAWGIYAVVALSLAYFKFRKDAPGLISATLTPVLGRYAKGPAGHTVDIIGVTATVIGVASTLGFGAVQINGGLDFLFGIGNNFIMQFTIIAIVTVLFMFSAWTGLNKGIKILSNVNMILALLLFTFMFVFGPTLYSLNLFTNTLGSYLQTLPSMSFRIAPLNPEEREWINGWTIFYWAWWIAWAPFVGSFIARVSKGRTLREFVLGVLFVPSVIGFLWFSVFGGSAIFVEEQGAAAISELAPEEALFGVFAQFPMGGIMSIIAIVLISTFFITSADSGTFILGMQTTNGSLTPPRNVKLIWGIMLSATSSILLYTGGLQAIENALIIAALPFSIIMILMTVSLFKALRAEKDSLYK